MRNHSPVRFGLCCIFLEQPIKFRNTTVKAISSMERDAALAKLSGLCMANAEALQSSLQFCADNDIGCFRINSQILPVKTHAECGYDISDLPDGDAIIFLTPKVSSRDDDSLRWPMLDGRAIP